MCLFIVGTEHDLLFSCDLPGPTVVEWACRQKGEDRQEADANEWTDGWMDEWMDGFMEG